MIISSNFLKANATISVLFNTCSSSFRLGIYNQPSCLSTYNQSLSMTTYHAPRPKSQESMKWLILSQIWHLKWLD